MSQPATRQPPLTVEEYLRLEEESTVRHEYVAGMIYALAGATKRHNRIAGNVFRRLGNAAEGGPCRVYMSDIKVRAASGVIYYPDVVVACGSDDEHPLIEDAPWLIVEVTSPSTEMTDRREKALAYRQIDTLQTYVIVHQKSRRVERHWRDEDGTWWHADVAGSGKVPIPCPEITLTLDEIYAGVEIPE